MRNLTHLAFLTNIINLTIFFLLLEVMKILLLISLLLLGQMGMQNVYFL